MADIRYAEGFMPYEIGFWGRALPALKLAFTPTRPT
jgi:hypothetical protein